jgi:class 3 adenylate cyclase
MVPSNERKPGCFVLRLRHGARGHFSADLSGREKSVAHALNENLLDERLAQLENARSWSPRLISKLESHIRTGDDDELFRINPFTFAAGRNASEKEVIDLFLHASALGLFRMDWVLFCPQCCCVVESLRSLRGLHNHYRCSFCQVGYETALDDYVAVSFTISPDVRGILYHHPERLSAWDHFVKIGNTRDGVLPDGTAFIDAKEKLAKVITYLAAGEVTRSEFEVTEGTIMGASPEGKAAFQFPVVGPPAANAQFIRLRYDQDVDAFTTGEVAPGKIIFEVENLTSERGTLAIAVAPPGLNLADTPITFVPFLTGKRLITTQTFRDLFRSDVIKASEGIAVKDITLLFTDLKESTALYDRIGDLNAFSLVQQHFDRLQEVTIRHNGAIIKTIGDAIMAAFLTPADAVGAALAMRSEIAAFNRGKPDRELILKIGVHQGAVIAVTLNERLDYFGQTVNIAARVQGLAEADEIYVSDPVYQADGVRPLLEQLPVSSRIAKLKGVQQDLRLYCVSAEADRGQA